MPLSLGPTCRVAGSVAKVSTDSQRSHWGLYRTGWVTETAPSRRMRGPLGFRIFLMADIFMRLSRRMRPKPLGETADDKLSWKGEWGTGHSRKMVEGRRQDEMSTHQSRWLISRFCVPT